MPQLVKKRRSGWAVLAAGAMVASLLAVGASPAAAAPISGSSDVNARSIRTACLGEALDATEFDDVAMGGSHYESINCIAYYGITTGTTASTFSPHANVNRSQMSLFLSRMADAIGADLGDVTDEGISDIGDLGQDRQDAINRLVANNIMTLRGDGSFDPFASVTRAEMAHWLVSFMAFVTNDRSPINVTVEKTGEFKLEVGVTEITEEYFADSRASQPRHVDSAIGVAFELGITTGYSNLTFQPNRYVSRQEMASFITRTLGHTNLRPAGLTSQAAGNADVGFDIQVSIRDADFAAIPNEPVDLFRAAHPEAAFDDDGACVQRWVRGILPTFLACEIDDGDQVTQDTGNAEYDTNDTGLSPEATTILCTADTLANGVYPAGDPVGSTPDDTSWAWTGGLDDKVDEDTDLFETVIVVPFRRAADAAPHHALVTGGLDASKNQLEARFSQVVEYTVQLHADPEKHKGPMGEHVNTGPDSSGNKYNLVITRNQILYEDVLGDHDDDANTPEVRIGEQRDLDDDDGSVQLGTLIAVTPSVVWPDENGTIPIPITHPDPDPTANNRDVIVSFVLVPFGSDPEADDYNGARALDANDAPQGAFETAANADMEPNNDDDDGYVFLYSSGNIIFSDDGIDHDRLLISGSASNEYRVLPSQARNNVIITVLDQYGRSYRGFPVNAVSNQDGDDADGGASTLPFVQYFVTRSNGSYAIGYSYKGDPITETLQVFGHEDRPERDTMRPDPDNADAFVEIVVDDPDTTDVNERLPGDGVLDRPDGDTAPTGDPDPALVAGLAVDNARVNLRQGLGAAAGANNVTVHWANVGQATSGAAVNDVDGTNILVIDVDNRTFVVNNPTGESNAGRPHVYNWDAFDTFVVGDTLVSMELFESVLSEAAPKVKVQVDLITWESYDYFRLNDRARWTIQATCTGGINDATS